MEYKLTQRETPAYQSGGLMSYMSKPAIRNTVIAAGLVGLLGACARIPVEHRVEPSAAACVFMLENEAFPLDEESFKNRMMDQLGYSPVKADAVIKDVLEAAEDDSVGIRNAEQFTTKARVGCNVLSAGLHGAAVYGGLKAAGVVGSSSSSGGSAAGSSAGGGNI